MLENSWSRLFRCSSATPATRWRCARRKLGWMLVILLWTVFVAMATAGSDHSFLVTELDDTTCSEVRSTLAEKVKAVARTVMDATGVEDASPQPRHLGVCVQDPSAATCCTGQMEALLLRQGEAELTKMVSDRMRSIKQTFITWTAKFDSYFQSLIERSKRSLYDLFDRNYARFFERNSQLFIDLFRNLRLYYRSDETNLEDVLDRFFSSLLQRMFSLLNDGGGGDLELTEDYLQCVAEHMDLLRPFDDVPQRLHSELRRSFLVARAFVQGLSQGKEIVLIMTKQSPDGDCSKMMGRMLFCQFCQGHSSAATRPCFDSCLATVSQCLRQTIELQEEWTNYLRMLLRLADRLSDPLNIESVVRQLDVKISEAMMTYHDNSINVTTLVEQNCGHAPSKTRQRRQMRPDDSTQSISSSTYSSSSSSSSSPSFSSALSSSPVSVSSSLSPSSSASFSSSSSPSSSSSSPSSSSLSSSSPSSSESSQRPTTRDRSGQRQQQRKEQRQRQRQPHDEQRREEQPGQHDGQEEERHQLPEEREEEPRIQHQEQQQREEQPIQTQQQKEQRRQQRQRERMQEVQRRQQQEELARQHQLIEEQQRQPLLHQEQESDQYTEQPQVTERQQHRQRLLSQPRESDQYIEQPPEERQAPRQRLQQRQPADSQQNQRQQREPGQPKQSQQPRQQQRQQRPGSTEQSLTELEQHLRDIRRKLEPFQNFWIELPVAMCGDVIAEPSDVTTCWNGSHLSRPDGVTPEYTRRRPFELTITIRQQILKLKVAADKLNQAYNGWTENDLDGSGNGLDFGSGTELETAPPSIDEIRTNAPEVASSRDGSGAKTLVRLISGSCRVISYPTCVPMLLSLFLVGFCFFYTLCR